MCKGTILYVGAFELPDKDAAAHRVLNNAKAFKELGYNVVFIDVDRGEKNKDYIIKNKKNIGFDCWSRKFPKNIFEWIKYLIGIKELKEIILEYKNVKAVICYNYQAIALARLNKYCSKNNIKVISDCTEWYEDNRIIKKIDTILRMKYINKSIDGVICISSYLEKYYKNSVKTLVIPPLVDLQEEKWKLNPKIISSDKVNFVYSGTPGKHKDKLNYIIENLSKLNNSNYIFTIIGIDKKKYLEYYPEHIKLLNNIEDKVKFLGRISHEESIKYVKGADYVVFIRENKRVNNAGFPTKFVESISCGTPVVTTRTSDLDKYLQNGENGFFINIEDNNEIVVILNNILNKSKEDIIKMKEICINSKKFYYKNYVSDFEFFLSKVLK